MDVSVFAGERIIQFVFQNIAGIKYILIVELFGNGNIILCNESLKILTLINSINVRHRILRPGLNYFPPPPRGVDPISLNFDKFLSLVETNKKENIDIKRWLGRNLSISKKFIEYIVNNSKIKNKNINELSIDELKNLFDELIGLIENISNGVGHNESCIILDENSSPVDISPFIPYSISSD